MQTETAPAPPGSPVAGAHQEGRRGRAAWTAGVVLAAALVLGGAGWRGHRARTFAPPPPGGPPAVLAVASPEQAVLAWRAAGLRGRTLVLFGGYPHFHTTWQGWSGGAGLSDANWLDTAIFENVVRRIYWVMPEADWPGFRRQAATYSAIEEVPEAPAPVSLYTASGVPLLAVTPSALPALEEPVLAFVDAARFAPPAAEAAVAARGLRCDLAVILAREAAR